MKKKKVTQLFFGQFWGNGLGTNKMRSRQEE